MINIAGPAARHVSSRKFRIVSDIASESDGTKELSSSFLVGTSGKCGPGECHKIQSSGQLRATARKYGGRSFEEVLEHVTYNADDLDPVYTIPDEFGSG